MTYLCSPFHNTSCEQDIFLTHLRLLVENLFGTILSAYGKPWKICPSPMLSCLMANCLERATDMTNGGSKWDSNKFFKEMVYVRMMFNVSEILASYICKNKQSCLLTYFAFVAGSTSWFPCTLGLQMQWTACTMWRRWSLTMWTMLPLLKHWQWP